MYALIAFNRCPLVAGTMDKMLNTNIPENSKNNENKNDIIRGTPALLQRFDMKVEIL